MFGRRKLKSKAELDDYTVEPMEPRVLLSADALGVDAGVLDHDAGGYADWDLKDADDWSRSLAGHDTADTAHLDPAGGDADVRVEIVFVDTGIENGQQLLADLMSRDGVSITQVHLIDSNSDGVHQIAQVLAGQQGIDAIHIISHGAAGQIQLGSSTLSTGSLDGYTGQLNDWGSALADSGDILIYGCDLAADGQGRALVNAIGILTGADVAASVDPTGHAAEGGDWDLEHQVGMVETAVFSPGEYQTWEGTLAAFIVDTNADTVDVNPGDGVAEDASGNTSLRAAIMEANSLAGADSIFLGADTYKLAITGIDDASASGDLDIRDDLSIIGKSPAQTIIDGNTLDRVFDIQDDAAHTVSLSNLKIENGLSSASGNGAGLLIRGSTNKPDVYVDNLWFSNNDAASFGAVGGAISNGANLTITNSLIEGNTAQKGGGIWNSAFGALTMENVTVSGNNATGGDGGGIWSEGIGTLRNVTVTANDADDPSASDGNGGGIFLKAGSTLDVGNSIIAGNTAEGGKNDVRGDFTSSGSNIIQDPTSSTSSTGFAAPEIGIDPLLGGLANNGGDLMTHAPAAPQAIDGAIRALSPNTDQRGFLRGDGSPDIGAYEASASTTPVAAGLWLSTEDVVAGGGQPGNDSWNPSDLVGIGDPQLNLGPGTTSGTFSTVFDADGFSIGWDLNAAHYVTAPIQIGSSNFQLLAGDLLLSPTANGTIFASNNATALDTGFQASVTANNADLIVFRPDTAGDYSKGQFGLLLQDVAGGNWLRGITLIEQTITVGGYTLQAGDFLYSSSSPSKDHSIWLYETGTTGAFATPDDRLEFIDGDDAGVGIQEQIHGIELLETTTVVGGQVLAAGTLLVNVDSAEAVGSNALNVDEFDVFSLNVSTSSLVGAGQATAEMLVDGSHIAFDANEENLDSLTLAPTSVTSFSPIANPGGPYTIAEGDQLDLDASASADTDGSIVSWEWDIGDNGSFEKSGETVSYSWTELNSAGVSDDGTVDVTLRVTDDGGAQTVQTFQVTVDNAAPTLTATGSGSVEEGNIYSLDLTASDPGDDTITSYTINWGDGTVTTEAYAGSTTTVAHTYDQPGFTYNITFSAVDEDAVAAGVAWTSSDLIVGTWASGTDDIYRFDGATGAFESTFATSGGDVDRPYAPVIGPDGNIYLGGYNSDNIVRYAPDGTYLGEFVASGPLAPGIRLDQPNYGLAWGADGNLYVSNYWQDNILRFDATGAFIDVFGLPGGLLDGPAGLAFGADGDLYVSSWLNGKIVKYDGTTGGNPSAVLESGLNQPDQLLFDSAGNLYIANAGNNEVSLWDGSTLTTYLADIALDRATGIAFGPDGALYVSSHDADLILRYDGSPTTTFVAAGADGLDMPGGLLFTPAHQVTVNPVNDAPTFGNNAITISQGGSIILDSSMLSATDIDNADPGLTFTVSGVNNGWFALTTDMSTAITSFDQSDVTASKVVFLHDGGELAPAYQVSVSDGTDSTAAAQGVVSFSDTANGVLWLSTDGDEGGSNGVPGLDAGGWNSGDILQQAGPNLGFGEGATDGTFSIAFDVANFAPGANINGMHFVTGNISIGSTNPISLQAGDLLLTTENDETLVSNGAAPESDLAVLKEDIFFFRPDKVGDYSKGNFYSLLSDPLDGDTAISALTLVEQDVWVGDVQLSAGDLLLAGDDKDIWWLATAAIDPTLESSYAGSAQLLIAGDDAGVDLDHKIAGLDVVESDISGGGQDYDAGTILLTLDGDDSDVGTTGKAVEKQDIVALKVIKTTLGAGVGAARVDATLMFDGDHVSDNDVNFDSGNENLDGLTLTVAPARAIWHRRWTLPR